MTDLEQFRAAKDRFFLQNRQSPLTALQKANFVGLRYFAEDPALRIRQVLDRNVEHTVLELETSTGDKQTYTRAGRIAFQVDGQECVLHLYGRDGSEELFLPFRDATSGKETYGAGRYLDVTVEPSGEVEVDFNYVYNPYCAYNDRWSCPVPPTENWLTVPIRAGERSYYLDHPE